MTITKSQIALFLFLAVPLLSAMGQEQSRGYPLRAVVKRGIRHFDLSTFLDGTHSDDPYLASAILQAGKTNDEFWVPYLKPLQKKRWNPDMQEVVGAAQMALAKLGEKEQLQEILCDLDYGTPLIQYDAINKKLKYVGGWFSIRVMADRMENDAKYRPLLKPYPIDVDYGRPPMEAFWILPGVVPNPPDFKLPPPYESSPEVQALRRSWLAWIDKNEADLRQLAPVGDGGEASEKVCRAVLKKDRAFDRSLVKH